MGWGRSFVATVAVAASAIGCSDDAGPQQASRVRSTGTVPRGGGIGVMDATLVGLRNVRNDRPHEVVVSRDRGRTWAAADLPDRPAELVLTLSGHGLYVDDRVGAVTGRDPRSVSAELPIAQPEFLVWTTTDGDEWTGRVLATAGGVVGEPTVTRVGPLLVASTSSIEGFNLFTSDDHGSSWKRAEVSGLDQGPGENVTLHEVPADADGRRMVVEPTTNGGSDRRQVLTSDDDGSSWSAEPCGPACPGPAEEGDLLHRSGKTSTDGGRTWQDIEIDPAPPGDDPTSLSAPIEVDGGWLASASRSEVGDTSYGLLLRSEDGRSWRPMLPSDACHVGRSNSYVSDPIRFDDRWYVTYHCSNLSTPEFGVVYAAGADGREFEPVEGTEREDVGFGEPVVRDGRLILPEYDDDGLVAITTIE